MSSSKKIVKYINNHFLSYVLMVSKKEQLKRALVKKPCSFPIIKKDLGITKKQAMTFMDEFKVGGVPVKSDLNDKYQPFFYIQVGPSLANVHALNLKDGDYSMGITSDVHVGDAAFHETDFNRFYDECDDVGVEFILNAGDIITGVDVYRSQHADLSIHTKMGQAQYVIDNLPTLANGKETMFITGNHDLKNLAKSFDPGPIIEARKPGWKYLGQYLADVKLTSGLTARLNHLSGHPYSKCFDAETHILSRSGWVLFKDLKEGIEVATLSNDGFLEWQTPTEHMVYDFKGNLIRLHGQAFDLVTTPNHRHWVKKHRHWTNKDLPQEFKFMTAEEIKNGFVRQKFRLKRDAKWEGFDWEDITLPAIKGSTYNTKPFEITNAKAFLRFLGWFIAEGHTVEPGRIFISQTKEHNFKSIINSMLDIDLTVSRTGDKFCGNNKRLKLWLDKNCGKGANNKKVPAFVKELRPELIKIFLKTLFYGDGHYLKNGKMGVYHTISNQLRDDVMELLLKIGKACTYTAKPYITKLGESKRVWCVCVGHTHSIEPAICLEPEEIKYDGKVYCVNVPNHRIMVMRNGKTCWSGNSYRAQKYLRELKPIDFPDILCLGHAHSLMYMVVQGVHVFECGAWQGENTFTKHRGLETNIAGWIVKYSINNGKLSSLSPELKLYE